MKLILLVSTLLLSGIAFAKGKPEEYKMVITEKGYEPSTLKVKAGEPFTIKITRKTNATCAREITVPSQKLRVNLPLDKEVAVKVAALEKGEVKFGCAMDLMVSGVMIAE